MNETPQRALVVDDEPAIRLLLSRILEDEKFAVQVVDSVDEGLKILRENTFDLALVDKNLPDGTGFDVVKALKAEENDCAIIMVTGFASVQTAAEALRLDVADYLEKPFGVDEVVASVRRALNLQRVQRDNRRLLVELKQKNEELLALSKVDPLTRLYNHAHFQESVEVEIRRHDRDRTNFSLLFVDIDEFKGVNDTHGHPAGDRAVTTMSDILRGASESPLDFSLRAQDIAARYGGDEFALILAGTTKGAAALKAERLRDHVQRMDWQALDLPALTVSVGVSTFPEDAADRADLIQAADDALYAAKRAGRNRIFTYSESIAGLEKRSVPVDEEEVNRLEALDRTIAGAEVDFAYQPIVDGESGQPFAYEALCRPRLFPHVGVLLETAERAGRILELGRVLRRRAAERMAEIPEPALLFINLHPQDLFDRELLESQAYLDPWASRVVFEITETQALRDYEGAQNVLKKLKERGFRIALDDLGSGYAGLNLLALLEPDFVKLDMELVHNIEDPRTCRLVRHIIEFAVAEGISAVGEGVELEKQATALRKIGCRLLQGYYFGRPSTEPSFDPSAAFASESISEERWAPSTDLIFQPGWKTGVATIDAQHKRLVKLLNRFRSAIGDGREDEERLLESLIAYCDYHFSTEERLMTRYGYPEHEEHHTQHAGFLAQAREFKDRVESGDEGLSHEVVAFLSAWVTQHIAHTDMDLGAFLQAKGL